MTVPAAQQHTPDSPPVVPAKGSNLSFSLLLLAVLAVGGSALFLLSQNQKPQTPEVTQKTSNNANSVAVSQGSQSLVYGVWEGNESVIHVVNTDGTGDQIIARIPLAVKNIHKLDSERLIYIADTDQWDHGNSIVIKNTATNTQQTVVSATPGWGIDSLIVSADGNWIAYWEVQLGPNGQLGNGYSRVYAASLTSIPSQRQLVFDENAQNGATVHYPLFFYGQNLYADGFTPNKDGWGKGLVRASIPPSASNQYTEVLADAAYNSDPVLSPKGNTVAYTAYNPSAGQLINVDPGSSGRTSLESLNPNTIMLLDFVTNTTRPLTTDSNRLYYDLTWKDDGSQIFARSYGSDGTKLTDAQAVIFDVNSGVVQQMDPTKIVDGMILSFGVDGLITGVGHTSGATGNLGSTYAPVLSGIAVGDGNTVTTIPVSNAQFITTIKGTVPLNAVNAEYRSGNNSLQLASFALKPELENRPAQQNNILTFDPTIKQGSWCRKIYYQLLGKTTSTSVTSDVIPTLDPTDPFLNTSVGREQSLQLGQFGPKVETQTTNLPFNLADFRQVKPILLDMYKCSTSPLYLYPTQPTRVQIKVPNNEILRTNVPYTKEFGWTVMADPKGTKIEYDYTAHVTIPEYGLVVSASDLTSTLQDYSQKIGLVGREFSDYVSLWIAELPQAEYYLITHFSNPSSIMKFVITPEPDVMIQTIMYFKPLSAVDAASYSHLSAPTFAPIPARRGFTAVDWSGIIDR